MLFIAYGYSPHHSQRLAYTGTRRFLHARVNSGRYQTTSEVVREALRLLERSEQEREYAFQQLKAKLEKGAAEAERGELLDGDEVFGELREMIEERRRSRTVNQ